MLRVLLHCSLKKQHGIGQVPLLKPTKPFFESLRVVTQGVLLLKLVSLEGKESRGETPKRGPRQSWQQGWENTGKMGREGEGFLSHRGSKVFEL